MSFEESVEKGKDLLERKINTETAEFYREVDETIAKMYLDDNPNNINCPKIHKLLFNCEINSIELTNGLDNRIYNIKTVSEISYSKNDKGMNISINKSDPVFIPRTNKYMYIKVLHFIELFKTM